MGTAEEFTFANAVDDARDLIRAHLAGDGEAAAAVLDRADLPVLASLLARVFADVAKQSWQHPGVDDQTAAARVDEMLRGVMQPEPPAPAGEEARQREIDAATNGVLLAMLDQDREGANVILASLSHADTAQMALYLAYWITGRYTREEKPEVRAQLVKVMRSGQSLLRCADPPDETRGS